MRSLDTKERLITMNSEVKAGKLEQACIRYGVGKNTMRKIADEANAVIRIGKCYLINFTVVDKYMDSLSGK